MKRPHAMTEPSIMPKHNREKGAHATQHNALRQVRYKERPKIDAEQQWMEPGKAFLALFIAEPELAPKTVKAPGALRDLRNKYAAVIQEFQQLPSIMPTLKSAVPLRSGLPPHKKPPGVIRREAFPLSLTRLKKGKETSGDGNLFLQGPIPVFYQLS